MDDPIGEKNEEYMILPLPHHSVEVQPATGFETTEKDTGFERINIDNMRFRVKLIIICVFSVLSEAVKI